MKKLQKIAFVFLIVLTLYSITFNANALDPWGIAQNFIEIGESVDYDDEKLDFNTNEFVEIIDFLWGVGLLIIVISTIILGMKYMLVSPNEKSRIKQATTPYIIGVVIIFGALSIWRLMITILEDGILGG